MTEDISAWDFPHDTTNVLHWLSTQDLFQLIEMEIGFAVRQNSVSQPLSASLGEKESKWHIYNIHC